MTCSDQLEVSELDRHRSENIVGVITEHINAACLLDVDEQEALGPSPERDQTGRPDIHSGDPRIRARVVEQISSPGKEPRRLIMSSFEGRNRIRIRRATQNELRGLIRHPDSHHAWGSTALASASGRQSSERCVHPGRSVVVGGGTQTLLGIGQILVRKSDAQTRRPVTLLCPAQTVDHHHDPRTEQSVSEWCDWNALPVSGTGCRLLGV